MLEIDVRSLSNSSLGKISVRPSTTVMEIKKSLRKLKPYLKVERQSIRTSFKGKPCKDDATVQDMGLQNGGRLYVKDLGPQIAWKTVFILEYLGPLIIYPFMAFRHIQSEKYLTVNYPSQTAKIAFFCWMGHFSKRLLETVYVHRFSHPTMPLQNLFRNCGYYWGFAFIIGYYVNHPLYLPPPKPFTLLGLLLFIVCELGNLSVHLLLRDLRPPGTTTRAIPKPNKNRLTSLFKYVSSPNYTYEFGAWFGFATLTFCLCAFIFAFIGLVQMSIWALNKHRAYKKEFMTYAAPHVIIPFIL